jgi:O-antigen biosynthesis protein
MPKLRDFPTIMIQSAKNIARGDFRSILDSLEGYLLYKSDRILKDNSIWRYPIWKFHNSKKRGEPSDCSAIKFIIICFSDKEWNKPAYLKLLKCLNNQSYKDYTLLPLDADSDVNHIIHALDNTKYSHICFIEQGDLIAHHALSSIVKEIQNDKSLELIYSDEDVNNKFGIRVTPYFKPQYAPLLLMSHNYMNAFLCLKLTDQVIQEIKALGNINQVLLYKLVLRTMRRGARSARIADVLYHRNWEHADKLKEISTKHIVQEEIIARKLNAKILDYGVKGFNVLKFYPVGNPKISIIIPFRDKISLLKSCVQGIETRSTYHNYEIILIDNRSEERETAKYLTTTRHRMIKADIDFNYSKLNNMGVQAADGEYLILLNNDTEVITPDWMENLLSLAQLPEVGAVGAKLLYPDNTIQHAGVVRGPRHINKLLGAYEGGYKHYNNLIREYSCVTGACLMVSKEKYHVAGGFTECLAVEGNDVDFCLKLLDAGYYNVYTPHCVLYHYESVSREKNFRDSVMQERMYIRQNWDEFMTNDRFFNPNFSRRHYNFSVRTG